MYIIGASNWDRIGYYVTSSTWFMSKSISWCLDW